MESHPALRWVVITAVALVLIGAAGIWYWQRRKAAAPAPNVGGEIFEQVQNPLKDELPQTNPFKAEANPFQKTETNPFIGIYENPFE